MAQERPATLARYDDVPYVARAYPQTHPDVLARVGRLHGVPTPDPSTSRILEVGCALATNLGPIAVAYPKAQLVGFDLSEGQIAKAQELVGHIGLPNLTLRHAGIDDVDATWGQFDYIIAHGIWSWVPPEVSERLLGMIRERLAPHGVAYVSYNAYPGWKQREVLRDMLLRHTRDIPSAREQARSARTFLRFFEEELASDLPEVEQAWLKDHARQVRKQPDGYLCHDYLSPHNRPAWLEDFVAAAEAADLAYLADAQIATMLPSQLPADPSMPLGADPVRTEQYLDYLRQRSFRCSLLVHREQPFDRSFTWERATELYFGSDGRLVEEGATVALVKDERRSTTEHPLLAAAFRSMAAAWPQVLSFPDLLTKARKQSRSAAPEASDRELLARFLHSGFLQEFLEGRAAPLSVASLSKRPLLSPWARAQLSTGTLTTLRHQTTSPGDEVCQILWACNGKRTAAQIAQALVPRVEATDAQGNPLPQQQVFAALVERVHDVLPRAAALSLFIA